MSKYLNEDISELLKINVDKTKLPKAGVPLIWLYLP